MPRSPDLLRPSACVPQPETPPPHSALLKIRVQPQFDRAVTDRSKPFLRVFQGSNPAQFRPLFFVLTVRSAEGRKLFWPPVVICQGADFSKIFSLSPHPGMHYFSASPHTNQWRIRTSPWSALRVSMVGLLFRFPDFPMSRSSDVLDFPDSWLFSASQRLRGRFLLFRFPDVPIPRFPDLGQFSVLPGRFLPSGSGVCL